MFRNDPPRPDKVEALVRAALDGMVEEAKDSSGNEVISAAFTLVLRCIRSSRRFDVDMTALRNGVQQLLAECADRGITH